MTDDRSVAALHRLSMRGDRARPLPADAQARIEARLDAAFSEASTLVDLELQEHVEVVEMTPARAEIPGSAPRRWWLAPLTAAAAAAALVIGLVMLPTEEAPPATSAPGLSPNEFPTDLLRPGTRWNLATEPIESGAGLNSASLTIRIDDEANGQARVATSDIPSLSFLGGVRFDVGPTGHVLVPLVLLDPERDWVDCAATIDLNGAGTTECRGVSVEYAAEAGSDDVIETPAGSYDSRPFDVGWSDDAADEIRTRLWISPLVGPVRIEIDDGDTTRTFNLEQFDADDAITTPTGD